MAKKQAVKEPEINFEDFPFDFDDAHDYEDDQAMDTILGHLVDANCHQLDIALELTRLTIDKAQGFKATEENILASFQKSMLAVNEHSPLKLFLEKMGSCSNPAHGNN